jgi:hypothetical protein
VTRIGFAGGNSGSGTLTQYYDNFRLESSAISSGQVPEPSMLAIFSLGALGMTYRTRGKRKAGSNSSLVGFH